MEVGAEEGVQYEQLSHDVSNVQQLHEQVENDQVVAMTTAAEEATGARTEVLQADGTPGAKRSLARKIPKY